MKTSRLVLAIFLLHLLHLSSPQTLTDQQRAKVKQWSDECQSQSGATDPQISKIRSGEYSKDPKVDLQLLCFAQKAGLIDVSGKILPDVLRAKLKAVGASDSEAVVAECGVDQASPQDSAVHIFTCLRKRKPDFNLH